MSRASSSPSSSSPATTPARSAALRFWLVFHLPLDLGDLDFDPDDRPALKRDEIGRRVTDRPGLVASGFLSVRQRFDLPGEPGVVFDDPRRAARLNHHVVPGRHDLPRLLLGRVPGRRDIVFGALEHDKRLGRMNQVAPLPVGAGDMSAKRAELRGGGIDEKGNRVGDEALRARTDQQPERARPDQRMLP